MKKRIQWIDTAKFLGIFAIYLGHFGELAGRSYLFVFQYHVPLFFFLSGCMSTYDKEESIICFIKKKFKSIMIPFFIFSFVSLIIYSIYNNWELAQVIEQIGIIVKGNIRNSFFAWPLWFLSCLFLMEIIFKVIKKLDNKLLIFILSLILFVFASNFIKPNPSVVPHWFYNLDSVFYYIVFYAIGYISYPYILKIFKLDTRCKKIIFLEVGIFCAMYAGLVFFDKNYLERLLEIIPIIRVLTPIIIPMPLLGLNLITARLVEKVNLFNEIGRNTLFLCGNEFIIKLIFNCLLELIGFKLNFTTPLHVYLYTMFLLVVLIKWIIPLEKRFINLICLEFKKK